MVPSMDYLWYVSNLYASLSCQLQTRFHFRWRLGLWTNFYICKYPGNSWIFVLDSWQSLFLWFFRLCVRPTVPQLCELDHQKECSVYMFTFPSKSDMSTNSATPTVESRSDDTYESDSKSDCWSDCPNAYNDYSSNDEKFCLATNEENVKHNESLPCQINTSWGNSKRTLILTLFKST